jgi:glycosyltransferase involved in cell wall biosynthesis
MKRELLADFSVAPEKVSVIPFGINNTVPSTLLTRAEARERLGLAPGEKVLLFFGNIAPYKGLEFLIESLAKLNGASPAYRLIIAGRPKNCEAYWAGIQESIARTGTAGQIVQAIDFIPDEEIEIYFKAADVLVLPYTHIFQSGVLFLGYSFGLPVIAANVGSLGDEIVEGRTGFLCNRCDAGDLAKAIERFFASDLFRDLPRRSQEIRDYANERYSWTTVGEITRDIYLKLSRK